MDVATPLVHLSHLDPKCPECLLYQDVDDGRESWDGAEWCDRELPLANWARHDALE